MVTIINTRDELIKVTEKLKKDSLICDDTLNSIGFVPTMGNLHKGHLSLVEKSLRENKYTFVSIFVNPTQFGPSEDYQNYPRTIKEDLLALNQIHQPNNNLFLFCPENPKEVYPENFSFSINESDLSMKLCGENRKGHFSGVCTVVYLLLSLIKPNRSYFGQKDYQQYLIIKKMVKELNINCEITLGQTVRNENNLALSSRNQYLTPEEVKLSYKLYGHIEQFSKIIQTIPHDQIEVTFKKNKKDIFSDTSVSWDYLTILDADNLNPITNNTKKALIAGAMSIGKTRLIDNEIVTLL